MEKMIVWNIGQITWQFKFLHWVFTTTVWCFISSVCGVSPLIWPVRWTPMPVRWTPMAVRSTPLIPCALWRLITLIYMSLNTLDLPSFDHVLNTLECVVHCSHPMRRQPVISEFKVAISQSVRWTPVLLYPSEICLSKSTYLFTWIVYWCNTHCCETAIFSQILEMLFTYFSSVKNSRSAKKRICLLSFYLYWFAHTWALHHGVRIWKFW